MAASIQGYLLKPFESTEIGWEILLGSTSPLIETAGHRTGAPRVVGRQRPTGRPGHEQIPFAVRIVAIADVFDA